METSPKISKEKDDIFWETCDITEYTICYQTHTTDEAASQEGLHVAINERLKTIIKRILIHRHPQETPPGDRTPALAHDTPPLTGHRVGQDLAVVGESRVFAWLVQLRWYRQLRHLGSFRDIL